MEAIVVRRHGGPEELRLESVPPPRPGPRDVLVRVETAGVNFIDVQYRSGRYRTTLPYVPGQEGGGIVVDVGSDVTERAAGDRVAWANVPHSYAELAVVPAERTVPVPDGLSVQSAAAVILQGMTAHYLANDTCRLAPGDVAVVQAAGGGVGRLLTQLVVGLGGRVVGTASSAYKASAARSAGAEVVVDPARSDLAAEVRSLSDGVGAAVVFDGVGRPTMDAGLGALRPRGWFVLYGQAGGPVDPIDVRRLAERSLVLTRPDLTHFVESREELLARASDVFDRVCDGRLDVRVAGRWPLARAPLAHEEMEERRATGKLLLACG